MKSQKYIGLIGLLVSVILLVLEIVYQHSITRGILISFIILTLYLGILSWQYVISGNWKKSILPALKITLIVGIIGAVIGLLRRFN